MAKRTQVEQLAVRMMQLAIDFSSNVSAILEEVEQAELPTAMTVQDVKFGAPFTELTASKLIFVKVRPVGQLRNSRLIGDALSRGDALVVNAANGNLHIVEGTMEIKPL